MQAKNILIRSLKYHNGQSATSSAPNTRQHRYSTFPMLVWCNQKNKTELN